MRRDRLIVLSGLLAVVLASWAWLLSGAAIGMEEMDMGGGQIMLMPPVWSPGYAALLFVMWAVMMIAMMVPSATPAIMLVQALTRQRQPERTVGPTGLFAIGYVLVWSAFSLIATAAQWALDRSGLLNAAMAAASPVLDGALLIAAGLYQWTPLKGACLTQCRAPHDSIVRHWRRGPMLAGAAHGLTCLGCCWALMALLFVGGLMNLAWIGGIALLILIEKLLPGAPWVSRTTGAVLVLWGGLVLSGQAPL